MLNLCNGLVHLCSFGTFHIFFQGNQDYKINLSCQHHRAWPECMQVQAGPGSVLITVFPL